MAAAVHPIPAGFFWIWGQVLPLLTLAFAIILAATPGQQGALAASGLAAVLVIHVWTVRRPGAIPSWLAFAAGLVLDALAFGPLGYWALTFLTGQRLAHYGAAFSRDGAIQHGLGLVLSLLALTTIQSAVVIGYTARLPNLTDAATTVFGAALIYPVVAALLWALTPGPPPVATYLFGQSSRRAGWRR